MPKSGPNRAGEDRMSIAVLRMAATRPDGEITLQELKDGMDNEVGLIADDLAESETRPGEPLFHQIIRNIVSHKDVPGNVIADGLLEHTGKGHFRISDAGRRHLARLL